MKINKLIKALSLLLVVAFAACADFEDTIIDSPQKAAGNQGVFFPSSNPSLFELEPAEATQVTLKIAREASSGSIAVPISVETNDDDVFNVPQSVNFADGETEVEFIVTFPSAAEGIAYDLKLVVEGDDFVDPYGANLPVLSTTVSRIKWSPVPRPLVYIDGTFSTLFGVQFLPMYVEADSVELDNSVRYRLKNAYRVPTSDDPDEDGIFDGYPYNGEDDFDDSKDWFTTIEIYNNGEVFVPASDIGVDWGYGMISIGSVYGNTSVDDKGDYPWGTFKDDVITFPGSSLFFSMAAYESGGKYPAGNPTTIYLSKEAYIAANLKIEDFNDVEFEEIKGELGVYESAAYSESWDKTLYQAIDIDEENEESEYKSLFYIGDVYADGYGLAFYNYEGVIRVPENQPTGNKVFGKDVYVSQSPGNPSSVETVEKGIIAYTFGLIFHYQDGTIVGDFSETYYYSKDEVPYSIEDFTGTFLMTGASQFGEGEDPAAMNVTIKEGTGVNTLIITGIDFAEEIIATFNAETYVMSIAGQDLADIELSSGTYAGYLHTTTREGDIDVVAMDFVVDLKGNLVLTPDSEADGYLIRGTAAGGGGGWIDGYHSLHFKPVVATTKVATTRSAESFSLRSSLILQERVTSTTISGTNFSIQGKKESSQPKRVVNSMNSFPVF